MTTDEAIDAFLAGAPHAVVGASRDRHKYGNKVLRCYQQANRPVYAVNPSAQSIEGCETVSSLASLPEPVHGISIITPSAVSAQIVTDALALGIKHLWFQIGSEHEGAIESARAAGCNVIAYGPCILVVVGFREGGR